MNDLVAAAVDPLYGQFGDAPLGRPLTGCEDCPDTQLLDRLSATPPRQLSSNDLDDYLYSAMSTVGDEADFKHFLPRLFELALTEPVGPDFELVGAHLTRARWQEWSAAESGTVREALEAAWDSMQSTEYEVSLVDAIVCGVALAKFDMPQHLARWAGANTPASRENVRRFVDHNRVSLQHKRRLVNAFWDESPAQEVAVADWIRSTMGVH